MNDPYKCPGCGGPTEIDRCDPPNPYFCSDECESKTMQQKTDYYKHIYSQRDVDLIRGDLMQRITELTTELEELVKAVEKAVAAWESHNFDGTPEAVAMERAMGRCEDIIRQGQRKEQDDEASL